MTNEQTIACWITTVVDREAVDLAWPKIVAALIGIAPLEKLREELARENGGMMQTHVKATKLGVLDKRIARRSLAVMRAYVRLATTDSW